MVSGTIRYPVNLLSGTALLQILSILRYCSYLALFDVTNCYSISILHSSVNKSYLTIYLTIKKSCPLCQLTIAFSSLPLSESSYVLSQYFDSVPHSHISVYVMHGFCQAHLHSRIHRPFVHGHRIKFNTTSGAQSNSQKIGSNLYFQMTSHHLTTKNF